MPDSKSFASHESLLSAIIDSSDDAIVSKDLDGIITSWNKAAERIFGFTSAETAGQPVTMLIPPDRQDEEQHILQLLRRGERVDHFETVRMRKDGTLLEVSLTISPVKNAEGIIVGASKIARDISERKKVEAEARSAAAEVEKQIRLKDEFLATLSHELRTPLQAILGWVQLLREEGASAAELAEGLEVIERNTLAQGRIVEDLLEMNRLMSGKVRLEMRPVDLGKVIEDALESVRPAARARDIVIKKLLSFPSPPVSGDAGRLQQVCWNLLTNAIKFTPRHGTITVKLGEVASHVEISVADSGIGIPAGFLPHVFERFRQADGSMTRQYGGLGLGLAIVKNLVELHGGIATARSDGEGKGATFTVRLPVAAVNEIPANDSAPGTPRGQLDAPDALKDIEILVIDDEPDTRALLVRVLSKVGASVITAGSAAEGLSLLETNRPRLIVCDIGLPGTDGYAFIRAVRALPDETVARIPALALTAYARSEDRMKAIAAGFQMHLGKPANGAELLLLATSLIHWRV
jgi:PAS domain S-box-containing protein